jgi:hypothetical protein
MKYYTFHVDDSGAIEDSDDTIVNGESIVVCKMYDDPEFNTLNDILHSLNDYIINEKVLNILKGSNTTPYELRKAEVLRKEKTLGFLKMYKSYDYYSLTFLDDYETERYKWINFEKSEIYAISNKEERFKILSHLQTLDYIKQNGERSGNYSFESRKVVFGKQFNFEIDMFKIPLYSWGHYISERLMNKLIDADITGVGFADGKEKLGKVWKPYFPEIEFGV